MHYLLPNRLMASLSISKVAVGCTSLDALRRRQAARAEGGVVGVYTRFRPKRAEELIGGSLYWIVRHRIVARQTIFSFAQDEDSRRTIIRVDAELKLVQAMPRRAHQGWRYLLPGDVPLDADEAREGVWALPGTLVDELSALALI